MRIEAIIRRVRGVLADQIEMAVKLGHTTRRMTRRTTHHGHQKAALRQRMEFIGYGGKRWVGGCNELGLAWVGNIPEEDLLLPFEYAEQPAAGDDSAVGREADVMHLVSGGTGFRQGGTSNHFAVVG